jgi:lysozyme
VASEAGRLAEFVARFEGFRSRVYRDSANVETIGYGETRRDVIERHRQRGITERQARDLLGRRLAEFGRGALAAVRVPTTAEQRIALTSLAYNIGLGAFRSSTLLRELNAGRTRSAADHFRDWVRAGGRVLLGLQRRREAERALFLSGPRDLDALTATERRLVLELDRLRAERRDVARRRAIVDFLTRRRKAIYRAADREGDWSRAGRRTRYRVLLSRTR